MNARDLLRLAPVMPVIVVPDASLAVDMARALVEGGLPVLEITLRTPAAFEAMRRIRDAVPGAVVGAGTVLDRGQWQRAVDSGAVFGVSPGLTGELAAAARASALPFLPGVATASEAMRAADEGFDTLKLFPAEAVGGRALLRSLHGPLPHLQFCPTGGIHAGNAAEYLALPNVGCVGGSWITPEALVAARDWARVRELAAQAAALRPGGAAS
jgi:2-dehydro-3-deoxyphosphogluconate aldolase/(4S)-4-hydroxy-2-oxoglutarate aldolase